MSESRPAVLIIGETTFPFHDFDDVGPLFRAVLAREADLTLTTDREALADLSEYDVLVDYLTDSTLSDEQLDGLLSFVEGGGGYVGVHCASDLTSTASDDPDELLAGRDEPQPDLRELIGGHFLTHPEQSEFGVEIVDRDHAITEGVEDFRVFDEPYQVECDDDVHVLAEMDHPDLERYPVAWTNDYGDGRVYYLSLGHTPDAFGTAGFQHLLVNGLHWAADR
jgi:hypothetical protein